MSQEDKPVSPNADEVICPNCCHQFRAIPQNVQSLMLNAGFEPPFMEPVAAQEPVGEMVGHHRVGAGEMPTIRWRDGYWPTIGTQLYANAAPCAELQAKITEQAAQLVSAKEAVKDAETLHQIDREAYVGENQRQAARIKALEAEVERVLLGQKEFLSDIQIRDDHIAQQSTTIERQRKVVKLSGQALTEVQDLIAESRGIYGLHLNGDESPWNEIEQGGRFERLVTLPEALSTIAELEKGVG